MVPLNSLSAMSHLLICDLQLFQLKYIWLFSIHCSAANSTAANYQSTDFAGAVTEFLIC